MELTESEMRTVFDAFDEHKEGVISTDRFLLLAQEYFGSANREEVKSIGLLEALDPSCTGYIDFQAFRRGVKTIHTARKGASSMSVPTTAISFSFNIDEIPNRATSDDDTHSNGTSESTFNEYDDSVLTDMSEDSSPSLLINEVFPSSSSSSLESQQKKKKISSSSSSSDHHGRSRRIEMDENVLEEKTNHMNGDPSPTDEHTSPLKLNGEEQYEDYGENDVGIEIDVQDLSSALDTTEAVNGQSPSNRRHFRHKSWNGRRLNRRISSTEFATQLYRSSSSNNIPLGPAGEAYGEYAASEGDIMELTDKVRELESQVLYLEKDNACIEDGREKLKSDNTHLHKHKELLEEQMKELDQRLDETVKEREAKYSEALAKREREFQEDLSSLQNRLSVLQLEREKLDNDISQYRSRVVALTQKNKTLEAQLQEADSNWLSLSVQYQQKEEDYKLEKEEMEDVIHNSNTMIDNLSRKLETLQANHQTEMEMKDALMRSPSIADLPSRFTEMKQEVHQLRRENQQLKDTNDELNVQLLNSSVKMGRSLLHKGVTRTESFASEMESSSKDEIMQALAEEKKITRELKNYVGKILEKVIEKHPSLLEIEPPLRRDVREGSISSESSMKSC
ncbi:rab11 family-interacting protein 4-like isoform X3 [Apostichopus japonicus]|uniref:rab11 family-interacting protein 4-like isoform X3 n=1 Tax=Stichopus japonicus TaxID=307972 RepID=UPI003AB4FCC6